MADEKARYAPAPPAPAHTHQPYAAQPMSMGVVPPPVNKAGKRQFRHGLFGCCGDPVQSIVACFLPCITYGLVKSKMEQLRSGQLQREANMDGSSCCVYGALLYCTGCNWILNYLSRTDLKRELGIETGCGDCLASCCCVCCDLVQQHQELVDEKEARVAYQHNMAPY